VFDATQEIETARIPAPLGWWIDGSPYNGSLYAGTLIGDIYQIAQLHSVCSASTEKRVQTRATNLTG
jgi:hypothetical protein